MAETTINATDERRKQGASPRVAQDESKERALNPNGSAVQIKVGHFVRSKFGSGNPENGTHSYYQCQKRPWEGLMELAERLPLNYVANIKTPAMVTTGETDLPKLLPDKLD